ncbi:hypothetical protein C3L23_06130 [Nautilia sp. PV-1]|uniref:hypothetical protein n=1 Tax=Nautilia sp. PV-1 TaxID=2579250 RepID=UPI000FDB7C62|nr:hypothetical protein [Nautilia sp. PV-1]AZV46864.1 hypothetical protein C3L23_06130 [Nautilia sp. PV-1]
MRRKEKEPTTQIRPSVSVEVATILDILAKKNNKYIGQVLEELLNESPTFKNARQKIYEAV